MVAQNMLRTHAGRKFFSEKKIRFVAVLDNIKCLKQIKLQRLLFTCAPISELPSTMVGSVLMRDTPVTWFLSFNFAQREKAIN